MLHLILYMTVEFFKNSDWNVFLGKFCVILHHHGATLVALWSLFLNSYLRKEDLRRCKYCIVLK